MVQRKWARKTARRALCPRRSWAKSTPRRARSRKGAGIGAVRDYGAVYLGVRQRLPQAPAQGGHLLGGHRRSGDEVELLRLHCRLIQPRDVPDQIRRVKQRVGAPPIGFARRDHPARGDQGDPLHGAGSEVKLTLGDKPPLVLSVVVEIAVVVSILQAQPQHCSRAVEPGDAGAPLLGALRPA